MRVEGGGRCMMRRVRFAKKSCECLRQCVMKSKLKQHFFESRSDELGGYDNVKGTFIGMSELGCIINGAKNWKLVVFLYIQRHVDARLISILVCKTPEPASPRTPIHIEPQQPHAPQPRNRPCNAPPMLTLHNSDLCYEALQHATLRGAPTCSCA